MWRCLFGDAVLSSLTKAQILTPPGFAPIRSLIASRSINNTTPSTPFSSINRLVAGEGKPPAALLPPLPLLTAVAVAPSRVSERSMKWGQNGDKGDRRGGVRGAERGPSPWQRGGAASAARLCQLLPRRRRRVRGVWSSGAAVGGDRD